MPTNMYAAADAFELKVILRMLAKQLDEHETADKAAAQLTGPERGRAFGVAANTLQGAKSMLYYARRMAGEDFATARMLDAAESGAAIHGGETPAEGLFACTRPAVASDSLPTGECATSAVAGRGGDVSGQGGADLGEVKS